MHRAFGFVVWFILDCPKVIRNVQLRVSFPEKPKTPNSGKFGIFGFWRMRDTEYNNALLYYSGAGSASGGKAPWRANARKKHWNKRIKCPLSEPAKLASLGHFSEWSVFSVSEAQRLASASTSYPWKKQKKSGNSTSPDFPKLVTKLNLNPLLPSKPSTDHTPPENQR